MDEIGKAMPTCVRCNSKNLRLIGTWAKHPAGDVNDLRMKCRTCGQRFDLRFNPVNAEAQMRFILAVS